MEYLVILVETLTLLEILIIYVFVLLKTSLTMEYKTNAKVVIELV